MIVFDLKCARLGHVFEGWFGSAAEFDAQAARGLVSCPLCGEAEVSRVISAPNVPAKGNAGASPSEAKRMLGALAAAQKEVLKGSEWVGRRFAEEARSMHLGESETRSIHGEATRADAAALRDEGVTLAPLPLPIVPPGKQN